MTSPWGPGSQPTPTPSLQGDPGFNLGQLQQQLGVPQMGSPAGSSIDVGVPEGFRQQVDLALRRKLGANYAELQPDDISMVAQALWNQTNGVVKQYYQQNPFPTSNQSLINQYLFSPSSPLPDLARQTIGLLPAGAMTPAMRRFLSSTTGGDVTQNVPMPFNPMYAGAITESHAEGDPGVDYGMPVGQPISTPVAGVVHIEYGQPGYGMQDEASQGWGRRVVVTTASGWAFGVGHLGPGIHVTEGQQVNPGQLLGVSGGDPADPEGLGGYSSGPHIEIQWISPSGEMTDPQPMMDQIFGGTTFTQLQSFTGAGDILGQGVVTTEAQQLRTMGYDQLLESIYSPIASALQQYLGRRPLASEIRQIAQLGLNSDQLKSYINSLPSHIAGLSHGTYELLQGNGDTVFQKLFGYQIPDSMVKELYDKQIVTPSAINLYLSQHPLNGISNDPVGMNAAYQAARPWAHGVWNDQPHPTDLHNIYKAAQSQGYGPEETSALVEKER